MYAMNWIIIAPDLKNKHLKEVEDFLENKHGFVPIEIYVYEGISREEFVDGLKHVMQSTHCIILDGMSMMGLDDYKFLMGVLSGKGIRTFVHSGGVKEPITFSDYGYNPLLEVFPEVSELLSYLDENFETYLALDRQRQALIQLFAMGYPFTSDCFATFLEKDDTEKCQLFLDAGMQVNARTSEGVPLICVATRADCAEKVKWLIDAGADINAISKDRGYSAVMDAVWRKNFELTKYLIDLGADLSVVSSDGQPILVLAVGNGNLQIVELLLEKGADPDMQDSMGMSARGYANLFKKPGMVEAFEKYPRKEAE